MGEPLSLIVVRDMFQAFDRGDISAVLDTLTDDIEWRHPGPTEVPFAGTRYGKEQVAEFFKILGTAVEFEAFEIRQFVPFDDTMVVLGFERQRVKSTGQVVDNDWAMVFTLRGDKIAKFHCYEDTYAVAAAHRPTGARTT